MEKTSLSRAYCLILIIFFVPSMSFASLLDHLREQNSGEITVQHITPGYAETSKIAGVTRPYCLAREHVNVRIYMYHYIRPTHRDPAGSVIRNNSITPVHFDEQMKYLAQLTHEKKVHIGFLSELEQWNTTNCFPHDQIVILTADDGRRDNYGYLFPATKRYGLKFNLGIIYDKIGMHGTRIDPFTTLEEIQEMIQSGFIEVQSHSLSHADLRLLPFQQQAEEICYSKHYLESLFDIEINTFIAPYGGMTSWVEYISEYCGYTYVLSTKEGSVNAYELENTPYDLQRIRVSKGLSPEYLFGK